MQVGIDIAILEPRWSEALTDIEALCLRAAKAAANAYGHAQSQELSIAFIDDAQIARLNADYRGKDTPTNVLSFPADGHNPAMGDIVIAFETCQREARDKAVSLSDHTSHLLIHGYLHLCGYDHEDDSEAQIMETLEIQALAALNIANPYEDSNAG
ncbi:MAG: rRNA maturation RNase YbeY [Robiginitomaculum sp.]